MELNADSSLSYDCVCKFNCVSSREDERMQPEKRGDCFCCLNAASPLSRRGGGGPGSFLFEAWRACFPSQN